MSNSKTTKPHIVHCYDDVPEDFPVADSYAIDTETMGLNIWRDRLCLVQLTSGNGVCYLVQMRDYSAATRLRNLLLRQDCTKIFHFGRFDIAILYAKLGVLCAPVYCTKIASKLCRTYTDRHGLKDLCRELLAVQISKEAQTSYWGADVLTHDQKVYAATDVLHLHAIKEKLDQMLCRENRQDLAARLFQFLPYQAQLDYEKFTDVFDY